jgi:hypothetical protein
MEPFGMDENTGMVNPTHCSSHRSVDKSAMEVNSHSLRKEGSSSELRPFLRVVSMIVSDYYSARESIGNAVYYILTEPLDSHEE